MLFCYWQTVLGVSYRIEKIASIMRYWGSVEKVGVAPDPKRAGPASQNLEYG